MKAEEREEDPSPRLSVLGNDPVLSRSRLAQALMVIVEARNRVDSLEVARGGGLQAGFELIQRDARYCHV